MMMKALMVGGMALALATPARASEWQIDPAHSIAQFSVKHMMVSTVRGQFNTIGGTLDFNDANPAKSTVEVSIDAASIDTREPKRDAHLKSPDFFDVAKYPTIRFKSNQVERIAEGKYRVTGDLTMRGQTHPVTLDVEGPTAPLKNPWGQVVRGVSATGKLNRKVWGLTWNKPLESAGGVLVGDEVQLQIDAELGQKDHAAKK